MINELFGPSIHLRVMELFLDYPEDQMNLREIARRTEKNPGSISRVMPRLVELGILNQYKIGKVTHAFSLNTANSLALALIDIKSKLENIKKGL